MVHGISTKKRKSIAAYSNEERKSFQTPTTRIDKSSKHILSIGMRTKIYQWYHHSEKANRANHKKPDLDFWQYGTQFGGTKNTKA